MLAGRNLSQFDSSFLCFMLTGRRLTASMCLFAPVSMCPSIILVGQTDFFVCSQCKQIIYLTSHCYTLCPTPPYFSLSGVIPPELGDLNALEELSLFGSGLEGKLSRS